MALVFRQGKLTQEPSATSKAKARKREADRVSKLISREFAKVTESCIGQLLEQGAKRENIELRPTKPMEVEILHAGSPIFRVFTRSPDENSIQVCAEPITRH